jgi:hypothetical protein
VVLADRKNVLPCIELGIPILYLEIMAPTKLIHVCRDFIEIFKLYLLNTTMLRPTLPRIGRALGTFRRSLHSVPPLTHNFQEGVPGLLSPNGFDMAWTQYQNLMVEKLNVLTAGM